MSKVSKVGQDTLKNLNMQIVLNHIRKNKEISRIDLADHTKLSPTTVSAITAELVGKRIVTETRIGESSGGRKPVMLGINSSAKYVITVELNLSGAVFTLVDLSYKAVGEHRAASPLKGCDAVLGTVLDGVSNIIARFPLEKERICGIGISLPGVIDSEKGKVLYSSKLGISDFELACAVTEKTGFKCYVFKDTDALVLGEYNFAIGKSCSSLIYINIEDGVGMSYINSGKLFFPGYGGGFELGHITIDSNGPECRCGNRGCLGAMVSEQPARSRFKRLVEKGYSTQAGNVDSLRLADIVAYSNRGDTAARYVLEEQARLLGTAVANVINLFNPELVIIGGPLVKCGWDFLGILRNTVKDRALYIYSRKVEIRYAKLGDEAAMLGIANEICEREIFKPVEL